MRFRSILPALVLLVAPLSADSIIQAIRDGDTDAVRAALDGSADANARTASGDPLLSLAIRQRASDIAALLVDRGADIEARDDDRWTPLLVAVHYLDTSVAALLVEKGADVNAHGTERRDHPPYRGRTPRRRDG